MNYTGFMNKLTRSLTPEELAALAAAWTVNNALDPYAGAVGSGPVSIPTAVGQRTLRLETESIVPFYLFLPDSSDRACIAKTNKDTNCDWKDWVRIKSARAAEKALSWEVDALLGRADIPKVDLRGKALRRYTYSPLVNEPESRQENDEVASLRRDVEKLKQQVAFLTGLVNLRSEPAPDPLAAAKSRGAEYKTNELANPDNLNLDSASKYAGRSNRMINLERKRGWLYAIVQEGNTRGYRYPKWQFDVPAVRLRAVLDILASSSLSCWALHNFLTRPHSDLDGISPSAALADSTFAIGRIIDLARRRVDLQQGAS